MNPKLQPFLQSLIPYVIIGVIFTVFIAIIIVSYYVLIWALMIGFILWIAAVIRRFLFPVNKANQSNGRIIEHDDKK